MGRRKQNAPAPPADAFTWAVGALWALTFFALAFVPDQKILRYKLLTVESGVAGLLACVIAAWATRPEARWRRTPLDVPVAAYALSGLLFYALSPERSASSLELTRMLFCAAAFFAATQTVRSAAERRRFLWFWVAAATVMGLYALLQLRGGLGPVIVPRLARPIGTFGNPIFFAAYLASSFIAAAALLAGTTGQERRTLWSFAAVLLAGALATQSRAAVAGLGAAALLAAAAGLKGRSRWAALGVLVGGALVAAWIFRDRQWTHGLIWRDTLALWQTKPLFGVGLGRFHLEFADIASAELRALWPKRSVIINFAHNEYLQVLAETGIVGLGVLLWVGAAAAAWARANWEQFRERPQALGLCAVALALAAQNVFSPDLRFGLSSFILFAALGAAVSPLSGGERPWPAVPGRLGGALIGAVCLGLWGARAAAPLIAQQRLAAQPKFHDDAHRVDPQLAASRARVDAAPADVDAVENLAWFYAKKKQWPEAAAMFERAHALAPARPGPLNNLGNIHYTNGRRREAIAYWKRSLAVKPDQIDAHTNLGKALYEVGELKDAAHHLQRVLELDSGNEKAQILLKKMIE